MPALAIVQSQNCVTVRRVSADWQPGLVGYPAPPLAQIPVRARPPAARLVTRLPTISAEMRPPSCGSADLQLG